MDRDVDTLVHAHEQHARRVSGGALASPATRWRREVPWDSPEFETATVLARRMVEGGRVSVLAHALTESASRRALVAMLRAPITVVHMSAIEAAELRACVPPGGRRVYSGRRAQAVLALTSDRDAYLAGGHRQALRTNLRRACESGIVCARSLDYSAWYPAARSVLQRRATGPLALAAMGQPRAGQRCAFHVARDRYGAPVAVAVAGSVRFGDAAYLFTLVTDPEHPDAASSRYALHTFVAIDLAQEGIRHLVVGSAVRESPGNQYFEHLVGYCVRNLRLRVLPPHE